MKILVTGASGQLGAEVVKTANDQGFEVYGFNREELDITNIDQVKRKLTDVMPNVVIHCAAYTKVDLAESEVEKAFQVNANGARNIAICAEEIGAKVCYISTDYVFDGNSKTPYLEYDRTNPINIYGKSKLAGEELTKTMASKYFIVRTSWLYGHTDNNFVQTMLRLSRERDKVSVVNDQLGAPTYTADLANFILDLVVSSNYGIYHASNQGSCTWYEFAKAIFEEASCQIKVNPISTEDFGAQAKRPNYSLLDNLAMRTNGFQSLQHWRKGLKEYFLNSC